MATEIRFNPSLSPASTTQADVTLGQEAAGAPAQLPPLMGGASLTVTTAPSGDLEKLVAQLKTESQNTRFSLMLSSLTSLNEALTDVQKMNLAKLDALDQRLDALNKALEGLKETLSDEEANAAVLDAKIAALEKAVEQAIQDGKDHNESVKRQKETRAEDDARKAKLEADLAAAKAQKAESDKRIATLRNDIATTQNEISSVQSQINVCISALGEKALENIASALQSAVNNFQQTGTDEAPSAAEERKIQEKEIANNPLSIIRESLDRLDAAMEQILGENREAMV